MKKIIFSLLLFLVSCSNGYYQYNVKMFAGDSIIKECNFTTKSAKSFNIGWFSYWENDKYIYFMGTYLVTEKYISENSDKEIDTLSTKDKIKYLLDQKKKK